MSSLRQVGRSAAAHEKGRSAAAHKNDRNSLCRFTFADGRQCRTPRSPGHPHLCSDHARKDSQSRAADQLADDFSYFFSGEYLSACDLTAALGRLMAGVARGDIKPRSARTLAYLSQTLLQTIRLAQHEYINALGPNEWRTSVRHSVRQNHDYRNPVRSSEPPTFSEPEPPPAPPVVAGLQTGAVDALPSTSTPPHPLQPAEAPTAECAPSPSPVCHPERSEGSQPTPEAQLARHEEATAPPPANPSHSGPSNPQFAQPPTPATQCDNPSTVSPAPKTVLPLDSRAYHFDTNYRLFIDGKPF